MVEIGFHKYLLTLKKIWNLFFISQELLQKVKPLIEGKSTNMRQPISPEEKLAVTLRFLATGESYKSLMYQFRIHSSTISLFIPKVCEAIYQALEDEYFSMPRTQEEWHALVDLTYSKWQFPNAFAAADGKHIAIYYAANSGAIFYDYKGFFSIVLLAFVDHDYRFIFADVGCQGRISDGGVYRNSTFHKELSSMQLNLPPPRPLPESSSPDWQPFETDEETPFVFVADSAFPLSENCMKPYPEKGLTDQKRIFNYKLSRFRRVTENAFGIMTSIFRIYSTKINLDPDKAISVVKATLVLHNLLRSKSPDSYTPYGFADEIVGDTVVNGQWRHSSQQSFLEPLPARMRGNKPKNSAVEIREVFATYLFGPGGVPWQWKVLV